jgi:MOSC domain-containing protein YiiM
VIPQVGRVEWIGRAPHREAEIESLTEARIEAGTGIAGDHHAGSGNSKRQVTLIQAEHLPMIAAWSGHDQIRAGQLRRNIAVSGINLLSLKQTRFRIGEVVLEGTGPCAPCSRMETTIGPGGYQAMRGHGGITAIVHQDHPRRRRSPGVRPGELSPVNSIRRCPSAAGEARSAALRSYTILAPLLVRSP